MFLPGYFKMFEEVHLRAWLSEKTGDAPQLFAVEQPLFTSGILDSFDLIELVTLIEQRAGLRVRARDINMDNLDSVQRVMAFVARAAKE